MVLAGVATRLRLGISDKQIDAVHDGCLVRIFTLLVLGLQFQAILAVLLDILEEVVAGLVGIVVLVVFLTLHFRFVCMSRPGVDQSPIPDTTTFLLSPGIGVAFVDGFLEVLFALTGLTSDVCILSTLVLGETHALDAMP